MIGFSDQSVPAVSGCICMYPLDEKLPANQKVKLPNGKEENVKDIHDRYYDICTAHAEAENNGHYIPNVIIAKTKIEHKPRSAKTGNSGRQTLTTRKGKLLTVEHKSAKETKPAKINRQYIARGLKQ